MIRNRILAYLALAAALLTGPAGAQTLAERLQQGIYTQETVGDLDAAIKIYRQIVTEGAGARSYAAQAQYRLGLCYLQKGQKADATAAFNNLIKDFPDQKDLVEQAQQYVARGPELIPAPWVDGELLEYIMRYEGGTEIGTLVTINETIQVDGQDVWRMKALRGIPMTPGLMIVLANRDTFRPLRSSYRVPPLGQYKTEYGDGKVTFEGPSKAGPQTLSSTDVLFDNEQGMQLFRRLPLAMGSNTTVSIFSPMAGQTIKMSLAVSDTEEVEVPAGKFDCFKVETKIGQTYWISNDAHRYPVRMNAGAVVIDLVSIRRSLASLPVEYKDDVTGFTLRVPPGWFVRRQTAPAKPLNESVIFLTDPDSVATTVFGATRIEPGKLSYGGDLRRSAQEKIAERQGVFKNYIVRPDSWAEHTVNGRPAISFVADFEANNTEMTEVLFLIGGDSFASWAWARTERSRVAEFSKQFDPLVDSFTVR